MIQKTRETVRIEVGEGIGGTTVLLNGVEVKRLVCVTLVHRAGEYPQITLEVQPDDVVVTAADGSAGYAADVTIAPRVVVVSTSASLMEEDRPA